jgi:hypothetical protein
LCGFGCRQETNAGPRLTLETGQGTRRFPRLKRGFWDGKSVNGQNWQINHHLSRRNRMKPEDTKTPSFSSPPRTGRGFKVRCRKSFCALVVNGFPGRCKRRAGVWP